MLVQKVTRLGRRNSPKNKKHLLYDIFNPKGNGKGLTKEEIKKVKKLAQSLLTTIKGRIHELDHWREKEETRSNISILIRDILWAELPESYDDVEVTRYRERIFEYVYTAYPAA